MEGAGRGFGEPNEIFNAHVGPHGQATQYMTREHRLGRFERVFQQYTDQKIAHLPQQLVDWTARAEVQRLDASRSVMALKAALNELHLDDAQVIACFSVYAALKCICSLNARTTRIMC